MIYEKPLSDFSEVGAKLSTLLNLSFFGGAVQNEINKLKGTFILENVIPLRLVEWKASYGKKEFGEITFFDPDTHTIDIMYDDQYSTKVPFIKALKDFQFTNSFIRYKLDGAKFFVKNDTIYWRKSYGRKNTD